MTGTASLDGAVRVVLVSPAGLAKPGSFSTPFLTALGGVTRSNLTILGNTAILNYSLSGSGTHGLTLDTTLDFTPLGFLRRVSNTAR